MIYTFLLENWLSFALKGGICEVQNQGEAENKRCVSDKPV